MKRAELITMVVTAIVISLIAGCAQQGAPTGGPKDEDPPVVLKADPPNYSTMFDERRIEIDFDEYLDMANFTQELVVSPPMEEKPIVKLRNKTLIIEFEEELKDEATYTFNFGEGIADLNERNVLLNYEYVFSTGAELDSLSVKGTLRNAFDLTVPETPILVMLYIELNDSIPLTDIPYYVGRTDKEGNFAVNNLRRGVYKLFVLKDGNNNFLFDLPNENIAYLDTSLLVDGTYFRRFLLDSGMADSSDFKRDTVSLDVDTTGMGIDSVQILLDSLQMVQDSIDRSRPDFNSIYIDLFMFTEEPLNRFIADYKRDEREFMELVFNKPVTDTFSFSPVYPDTLNRDHLIPEFGTRRDTLVLWAADTNVAAIDTIAIAMNYTSVDTMQRFITVYDTLTFTFREKSTKRSNGKSGGKEEGISIKTVSKGGKQHFHRPLSFTLERPLQKIDPSLIDFYVIPDTIDIPVEVTPLKDSMHMRRVKIDHSWTEDEKYRVVLYPGAITDIFEGTNDTIDRKFTVKPVSDYGRLVMSLEGVTDTVIIQVMKGKDIVRSSVISDNATYEFEFLDPATYRIKFVHDRNGNGRWDSGRYLEGIQPEKVEFLPKDIKVRANWDHDVSYRMGSNDGPPSDAEEEAAEQGQGQEGETRDEGTLFQ